MSMAATGVGERPLADQPRQAERPDTPRRRMAIAKRDRKLVAELR
jgi:hypothetical protein